MTRFFILATVLCGASALTFSGSTAQAEDAERGRRLVQTQCSSCHGTPAPARGDVADAPPFDAIARKYRYDPGVLAAAILGPHPMMNFTPEPDDAHAIAAYLSALPR